MCQDALAQERRIDMGAPECAKKEWQPPHLRMDPWIHRSAGMRCRTCIWFVPKQRDGVAVLGTPVVGRCRRHAPTMGGYPVVYETDWCGDHRLDENKL